jgi:hypothetical protein
MDLTPKQQTSEAIRQAENVLITTGQRPSVDQVSAVIGLAMILRKFGKQVTAVISDPLPQSVQLLETSTLEKQAGGLRDFILKVDVTKTEVDKVRYELVEGKLNIFVTPYKGNFAPSDVTFDYGEAHLDFDLAIILGVPNRSRIDRIYEANVESFEKAPMVNLDFHRSNENYGAVNLIEPNASSLCEMLVALSESLQGGIIDDVIATALLMGIVASTDRFTAPHTTSKSLTVAAQMMAAGAKQQAVVRALYRDGKGQNESSERSERGQRSDREQRGDRGDRGKGQGGGQQSRPTHEQREERQPEARVEQRRAEDQPKAPLPIIDPGHIELMAEPEVKQSAEQLGEPVVEQPAVPEFEPLAPVSHPAGEETSQVMPTEQTSVKPPLADFAAAAEILAKRQNDDESADSGQ